MIKAATRPVLHTDYWEVLKRPLTLKGTLGEMTV